MFTTILKRRKIKFIFFGAYDAKDFYRNWNGKCYQLWCVKDNQILVKILIFFLFKKIKKIDILQISLRLKIVNKNPDSNDLLENLMKNSKASRPLFNLS